MPKSLSMVIVVYYRSQRLASQIQIAHIPLIQPNIIGKLNPENAPYVLSVIQEVQLCLSFRECMTL
jgi:hypothetical protein